MSGTQPAAASSSATIGMSGASACSASTISASARWSARVTGDASSFASTANSVA
jgi:hypothetical protein